MFFFPSCSKRFQSREIFKLSDILKLKLFFWVYIGLGVFSHVIFEIE